VLPLPRPRCRGAAGRTAGLDTREGLASKVVVAGQPDKSELVKRIFSEDDDERMPPPDSKLSLSADQKELLRRWITEGAKFAEHWAFQPLPDKISIPAVQDESWPRQPLDRFVLARLENRQVAANEPSRRSTTPPPRNARPDRPAADRQRMSAIRKSGRQELRHSLRASRRQIIDKPSVRRAHGRRLARRCPLR